MILRRVSQRARQRKQAEWAKWVAEAIAATLLGVKAAKTEGEAKTNKVAHKTAIGKTTLRRMKASKEIIKL